MRKSFLGLVTLLFIGISVNAQDANSALKMAKKMMDKITLEEDAVKKANYLESARQSIDLATAGANEIEEKNQFKLWYTKGEVYNKIANTDINASVLDNTYKVKIPNAASLAYEAFKKALGKAVKKWQTEGALNALVETGGHMSNSGRMMYTAKDFKGALNSFEKVIELRDLLKSKGKDVFMATPEEYNEHLFMTGLSASISNNKELAEKYFKQLYDAKYDSPAVYDGYFRAILEKDEETAIKVLNEGRKKYPDDEGLLVAEINYYLAEGKLDELVKNLEVAIANDPKNISYVSTLGNVYDNLSVREKKANNLDASNEYFDKALSYYNQALELDPKYQIALYNAGTLYYNRAAGLTNDLKALESDYSKAGTAKYNAKKEEIFKNFDLALPYFEKSEAIDAHDLGTLTALKEIYAKKDNLEKYNEYKARLEALEAQSN